ncbi:MAG: hypothetical protein DSY77_15980 [Bacteroidetes bacterium]|nr:MAG: hypothetical protein DSY77_15980 [Bacteroidota bacterium]
MSEEQKKLLETQLWNIANELRGKMDADEFRDYILGFIFYKYLSEKQFLYANKLLETETVKDYLKVTNADDLEAIREESLLKLGYYLKPDELFSSIAKKGNANTENESNFILADLDAILNGIEQSTMGTESEDDFNKLFEDLDLNSTKLGRSTEARNSLISKVLFHLDKIDFALEDAEADVLGDAYEYLIGQFAAGGGKKAGEFYTPHEVSLLMSEIVAHHLKDKKEIQIYDPTSGSGSLLINIGSCNAERMPFQRGSIYAMSKSALQGLVQGLARDLGPRGITINNVQPGPIDTDMNPDKSEFADMLKQQFIAMPRYGTVDEVAAMVAYLAGPEASYVTGASLTIDGGFNA